MSPTLPRALVFMTGRNCEMYVEQAVASLARQTHDALHVLLVDDASDDATARLAQRQLAALFPGRHTLVRNPERWGKARNAHVHLREALPRGDFVAVLDADDMLVMPDILARMAERYGAGFDVVWSDFVTDRGGVGSNGALDPLASPRTQGWKTSHLFSFRAELLRAVDEAYFKDDSGAWFEAACDQALAFPVLDQTRRYAHLPLQAYRYTCSNPQSHHNLDPQAQGLDSRRQRECAAQVRSRPPLPCTRHALAGGEPEAAVWHGLREAMGAALQVVDRRLARIEAELAARHLAPDPAASANAQWMQAAAAQMTASCPALLDLALIDGPRAVAVDEAWVIWRLVQSCGPAPRVLEVGAGRRAAALMAAVLAQGGQCLSLATDRLRSEALHGRLRGAGLETEVLHGPVVEAAVGEFEGRFADPRSIDDGRAFDLVFVSADVAAPRLQDAALALPLLAPRLAGERFRFCLEMSDAAVRARVEAEWRRLAPDLDYRDAAVGGATLLVAPAAAMRH